MDHGHLAGNVGQVERLFNCSVAAADHGHFLIAIEKTIAGGAGRYAASGKLFFRGQAKVLGGRASGDDQRIAGVFARVADQLERALAQLHGMDVIKDHLGVEAFGMLLEARHQVWAHHTVGIGRPVIDLGRRHQLSALGQAGDQHRIQVGAGSVNSSGVAGGAGAKDEQTGVLGGHDVGIQRVSNGADYSRAAISVR
ncbi:hypothetical protein SDC9_137665 [bioreactor metagenome]|uniref:Uncharacterized protein n=1 Tax=bioreactor metagenome TaxID=1076179 RepID=A0A645DM63_9ZZZZ